MDLNKLTLSDKIIAGSGIVLFIAYFLTWFTVDAGIFSADVSGGDVTNAFLFATIPMLIGLVMAGVVIASKLFDVKLPELPVPWGTAMFGAGALAALLVVMKLLLGEDDEGIDGIEINRGLGLFLATLAALGLAAGGFLKFSGKDGDAGSPPPPPGAAPF